MYKGRAMTTRTFNAAMACMLALACSGCVERTLTITSDPPNALVLVSYDEKGRTPTTFDFTWYGDYEVIISLDGYETLHTRVNVKPPMYDIPPFDLLSELAPWTYRVQRSAHFQLKKLELPDDDELIRRSAELREKNREGSR